MDYVCFSIIHCIVNVCFISWLVFRRKILCDAKPKPVSRKFWSNRGSLMVGGGAKWPNANCEHQLPNENIQNYQPQMIDSGGGGKLPNTYCDQTTKWKYPKLPTINDRFWGGGKLPNALVVYRKLPICFVNWEKLAVLSHSESLWWGKIGKLVNQAKLAIPSYWYFTPNYHLVVCICGRGD